MFFLYLCGDTLDFTVNVLQPEFWGTLNRVRLHGMVYTECNKSQLTSWNIPNHKVEWELAYGGGRNPNQNINLKEHVLLIN